MKIQGYKILVEVGCLIGVVKNGIERYRVGTNLLNGYLLDLKHVNVLPIQNN